MKRLNSKEKKVLLQKIQEHYGFTEDFNYDVLLNENKMKYYLIQPEVLEFPVEQHRVETIGLYFGQLMPEGVVRFTVDGSQIIGPHATKQIFELSDEQFHEWIRGRDLEVETGLESWIILKHGDDYVGSGKIVHKSEAGEEKTLIHNYVPKTRYVRSED